MAMATGMMAKAGTRMLGMLSIGTMARRAVGTRPGMGMGMGMVMAGIVGTGRLGVGAMFGS